MSENGNNGNGTPTKGAKEKKPNFLVLTARKIQKGLASVQTDHPVLYKVGKGLTEAAVAIGIYKIGFSKGQKSVVPTTVYITPGVEEVAPDDVQEEETPAEEANEEPVTDELGDI